MTCADETDPLCTQCGLCCNGTFFSSVIIRAEEEERLTRVGLRVIQDDGAIALRQSCSGLRDGLCSVYADRPSACARYECLLRKSFDANLVSLEDALAKVARMRELLATIRGEFDVPESVSIWERILLLGEVSTAEPMTEAARRFEPAMAAVGELLDLGRADFDAHFSGGPNSTDI